MTKCCLSCGLMGMFDPQQSVHLEMDLLSYSSATAVTSEGQQASTACLRSDALRTAVGCR